MQKVKITKVYWGEVETQYGKSQKIGIKTETHGDKWLSCFESKVNSKSLRALAEGQEVAVIVSQKGDFLNFRLPTGFDYMEERVAKLEAAVFGTGKAAEVSVTPDEAASDEPNPDDVPF